MLVNWVYFLIAVFVRLDEVRGCWRDNQFRCSRDKDTNFAAPPDFVDVGPD